MITTSAEFGEQMGSNARKLYARFLLNGETVEGEVKEVKVNKGACGDSAFTIGNVYSSYITVTIDDCPTLLENQELELQIGVELTDGTVEYCTVGFYTASDVATSVGSTTFTGLGRLSSKCGSGYWSDNGWPQTVQSALDEIAEQTGVSIDASACDSTALALNIETSMDGLLHREALMYIAGLLGGFATESSDGGIVIQPFTSDVTAEMDADRTTEMFEFSDYDFTVTGVEVIVSESGTDDDGNEVEGVSYTHGTPNLTMSNPYMTQALFDIMAPQITGFTYRPGTVPIDMGDIRLEAGDVISAVDAEGVSHTVACLLLEHTFDGGLMTTVTAPGESETEQEAGFTGSLAAAVQKTATELLVARQVTATKLEAVQASITELAAKAITTEYLTANYITANDIAAKYVTTDTLTANYITATDISAKYVTTDTLTTNYLSATDIAAKYVTTDTLTANYITANDIAAKYVTTNTLTANYITASDIKAKYATIDLANVSVESVGTLFADVGLLTSMTVVDGYITGELNGVTISASQLTAGTIDAGTIDVVNLNCANLTVGTINGSQIASGTITAENLSEDITSAITTAQRTADGKNAVYYSDTAPSGGTYSVNDIWYDTANGYAMYYWSGSEWVKAVYGASALSDEVTDDIAKALEEAGLATEAVEELSTNAVTGTTTYYAVSDSRETAPTEDWSTIPPDVGEGEYLWQKSRTTYANGGTVDSTPVCISGRDGNDGADGEDAVLLRIDSSRGTVFKNASISTVLSATIYYGSLTITDAFALASAFGASAYLEWSWQKMDEDTFGTILSTDSRLSNSGFSLTLTPDDIDTKAVFQCSLNV